jgi:NAD(P)-dependent dehydrogenase (short-subunit alcohol dehydrogenase family)
MDPLAPFRLDDHVVVLTGASSGLGVGFAEALGAVGATLVLAARRADQLESVAAALRKTGVEVLTRPTDVSDPEDCQRLVTAATEAFGRVDGLVNNAGVGLAVPASRITPDEFRRVVDVNLNGTFWMSQACARVMPRGSAIVNVASVLGLMAPRFPQAPYAASKAAVIGLTRDLAQEWSGRKGIRVNALCPGYFRTDMLAGGEAALENSVRANSVLGRFGEHHELHPALLFLVSDASSFVTGTTLTIDGGLSIL